MTTPPIMNETGRSERTDELLMALTWWRTVGRHPKHLNALWFENLRYGAYHGRDSRPTSSVAGCASCPAQDNRRCTRPWMHSGVAPGVLINGRAEI